MADTQKLETISNIKRGDIVTVHMDSSVAFGRCNFGATVIYPPADDDGIYILEADVSFDNTPAHRRRIELNIHSLDFVAISKAA